MPDIPLSKVHPHPAKAGKRPDAHGSTAEVESTPRCEYAELHCVTNFSFLRGASHPDELVAKSVELGYAAVAITDEHSLAGVVRAHVAAKERKFPLIVGAEITPDDAAAVVLLATDRAAYGRLSRLLTIGRRRAAKGTCLLHRNDIAAHAEGLLAIGIADESALRPDADESAMNRTHGRLAWLRDVFGDRAALEVALHDGPDDRARLRRLDELARRTGLPLVAAGNVDAHVSERRAVRDTLIAIRHGCAVSELGSRLPACGVKPLRDAATLQRLHAGRPELLRRSVELAARCHFSLDELRYEYPAEGDADTLRRLVEHHARERWPEGMPAKVRGLIEHEMALVAELQYERYFLTVHELVHFARGRGILCQGRGSAANSAICYVLGITSVDPDRFDVLFERFVSRDRHEPPDIDVDFEHERREEVLQHIYEKYGRERAAIAATVITYRGRSAMRDVGKALGLTLDQVDRLATGLEWWDAVDWPEKRLKESGFDPQDPLLRRVIGLTQEIQGFPRHLSQHVGGMVITAGRLDEMVPIENAAMDDRTVIQWDKDDLDALGILKVDCLSLGMLTAIRRAFEFIEQVRGRRLGLADVPAEDPEVYRMLQRADTIGVFQIESRAQMAMLPRLKPREFYDLVIEVAIVRPGPIQGGMVHPYLRRREGSEQVSFPSEAVRSVLQKTLGVPIFQEQAMRLAVVAAGFTPGEADQLRRAMGAWRRAGLIQSFEKKLVDGMLERGYAEEFARGLFKQLLGFGEYGFPESHAASFALLTYVSSWLKRYEPACFAAALLNSQPMGFYAPAQLVRDARSHGVVVHPVDVSKSFFDCTLEAPVHGEPRLSTAFVPPQAFGRGGPSLRLGFRMVKGLSRAAADRLVAARSERAFDSVEDCKHRGRLNRREATLLADAGAFGELSPNRRAAWWDAAFEHQSTPLLDATEAEIFDELKPDLEPPSLAEVVVADYKTVGLSLEEHPMALLRDAVARYGAKPNAALSGLPHGRFVTVAGLVINRQRPATASGVLFMTLEDETAFANLIVRVREQERFRTAVINGRMLLVRGVVERAGEVIHLMVHHVTDLTELIARVPTASRDFH